MDFIEDFDDPTGTVVKISSSAYDKLEFPVNYNGHPIYIIGTEACKENNKITELDFSKTSITKIEYQAFYDCFNIEKITLPSSIVTIEVNAFRNTKINEITLPSSVETFEGAFSMCWNLNYINIVESEYFITQPEDVYNNNFTKLIRAHANVTFASITHFNAITSFGKYAFSKTNIDRFTCTDKISDISEGLFEQCLKLFELDLILSTTTSIGKYCFKGCESLKTVILPSEIQVISRHSFYGCSISALFIPSSLTEVAEQAFYGQTGLTRVYYFGLTNFDIDAFMNTNIDPIIYVPLNYKYETLFKKSVTKTKLNDMFIITDKCPKTNNCNNPFNRISQKSTLFAILISGINI